MNGFIAVAFGGALGASARHGVNMVAARFAPDGLPYATFTVNVIGSFAMGFLISWLALKADGPSQTLRLFLATGILGGFTTFSAFSLEVSNFLRAGEMMKAASYAGLSVIIGVGALFAGLEVARRLFT